MTKRSNLTIQYSKRYSFMFECGQKTTNKVSAKSIKETLDEKIDYRAEVRLNKEAELRPSFIVINIV